MHHIEVVAQKKILPIWQLPKYTLLVPVVMNTVRIRHITRDMPITTTRNCFVSSVVVDLRFNFLQLDMEEQCL